MDDSASKVAGEWQERSGGTRVKHGNGVLAVISHDPRAELPWWWTVAYDDGSHEDDCNMGAAKDLEQAMREANEAITKRVAARSGR